MRSSSETGPGEPDSRRFAALTGRPELIPGLLAVATFLILAASQGGSGVTSWAPAGLFMLALTALVAWVYRARLRALRPATRWAIGLLAAFVLWSYASIAWAEVDATAWDGANRALVYLLVFAAFSIVSWWAGSAALVLGLYSVGLAVIAAIVLIDAAGSTDAALFLVNGRLAEPTGYANAVSALFIGGFWPAAHLASRREVPWALRGILLAVAGLLIQVALMPQSRASLLVMPAALILYLLVVPNRLRAAMFMALPLAATALAAPAILDVFATNDEGGDVGAAFTAAAEAISVSFVALAVVGTLLALADRRLVISEASSRTAGRIAGVIAAVLAVAALASAVVAVEDPIGWVDERWQDFKGDYDEGGFGSTRFSGDLGSGRYDFWRVALSDGFGSAPFAGEGADNFAVTYLEHRETGEEPLYPHSLPMRLLAGTGVVGTLLFSGFLVAAAASVIRTRARASEPLSRAVAGIALAAAGYFFLHAGGDWLWTFAGIAMPVMAWLGMAGGGMQADGQVGAASRFGPAARVGALALVAALAIVAVASLTFPWLAARLTASAAADWQADPEAAYSRLDTARALNPLSPRADLVAGTIAVRDGDEERARIAFTRAADREPTNWFALLEQGTLDIAAGRRAEGLAALKRAEALNPNESLIASALRRARSEQPLTSAQIDRELLDRVCARVGATRDTRFCSE